MYDVRTLQRLAGEFSMTKKADGKATGFGARLASYRKSAGFTQEQLAIEIGVSRRRIAYYERETQHPPTTIYSLDL